MIALASHIRSVGIKEAAAFLAGDNAPAENGTAPRFEGLMIPVPVGVRVWLASGRTDMLKGFAGLVMLVQETLKHNPNGGQLFVFRGQAR